MPKDPNVEIIYPPDGEWTKALCAWHLCKTTCPSKPGLSVLPEGWKAILIYRQDILKAEVDGVLCPEHATRLTNQFRITHLRKSGAVPDQYRS